MSKNVKAKDGYSAQILPGDTSRAAVLRVRTQRAFAPLKAAASFMLLAITIVSSLGAVTAGSMVTAQHAQADVVADLLCVNAEDGSKVGSWDDGKSRFSSLGGSTQSMEQVRFNMLPTTMLSPSAGQVTGTVNKKLTAYEKYGSAYPVFESWTPAWTDDSFLFQGVGPTAGLGSGGQLSTGSTEGSEPLAVNSSRMLTNNSLSCVGLLANIEAGVANILLVPSRVILGFAATAYDSAVGNSLSNPSSPLYGFGETVDNLITKPGGIRDGLFIPFLIPLVLIGAIWVGYVGVVKRKATAALQSTVWMVAAIAAGTVFLAQPTLLARAADSFVGEVQQIINTALPFELGPDSEMCSATGENQSKREAACLLWKNSLFEPWAAGQFGNPSNPEADPRGILNNPAYSITYGNESVEAASWPQFMVDRQSTGLALQNSETAYAQLSGGEKGVGGVGGNPVWAGGVGTQIMAAVTTWLTVPVHGIVPLVLALFQLFFQLMMLSLVFFSPIFFLLGIVPNWGRRVLMRLAELLVAITIKRVVVMTLLAFYFVAYGLVTSAGMSLILETAVIAVLAAFILIWRGRLENMLTSNINFGGNKSIGLPGAKLGANAVGIAGGAAGLAAGGLFGAVVGGLGGKKAADSASAGLVGAKTPSLEGAPAGERPRNAGVKEVGKAAQQVQKTASHASSGSSPAGAAVAPAAVKTVAPAVTQAAVAAAPAVVAAVAPPAAPVAAAATQAAVGKAAGAAVKVAASSAPAVASSAPVGAAVAPKAVYPPATPAPAAAPQPPTAPAATKTAAPIPPVQAQGSAPFPRNTASPVQPQVQGAKLPAPQLPADSSDNSSSASVPAAVSAPPPRKQA